MTTVMTPPPASEASPGSDPSAPPPSAPPAPDTPGASGWADVARRVLTRRNVLAVLAVALLVVVFDRGVAPAMARYQQHHRADDFLDRRPTITTGDSFALLQITSIRLDAVVVEGDSRTLLRGGPGHVASSPAPGEPGNVVIAGRSSRFGADFASIHSLKVGEPIVMQVRGAAGPIKYVVEAVATIGDGEPLPASSVSESLTLVTSSGGLRPRERVVVVAARDGAGARDASLAPTLYPAVPPTAGEATSLIVWGLAGVVLIALARRAGPAIARLTPALLVAVVPVAGTVALKFALACDALLPALS